MARKIVAILVLLCASLAWGQTYPYMSKSSSHSGSLAMVDHHPYCGGASGTLNCWHQESSTFTGVWATTRGMLATDSSGCVWLGSSPIGLVTWTKQTSLGCGLTNPQYDSTGNLYALDTGSGNLKFVEDQSGTWQPVNGATATQFSIAADGEQFFGKVNAAGALNVTADPTHAWTALGSSYKYVQILSSQNWLAVKANGTIWLDSHGTWTQIGTNSNAVQVNGMSSDLAGNPMIYYLGSDGCVYHMNQAAPTGWDKLNGCGMTALAAGGILRVMSLGGTGGTHLYRFGDISPTLTIGYHGQVNCTVPNPPGPGYCNQYVHNAQITSCWGSKDCTTVHANSWNGVGQWNITATSLPQDDPIACLDDPTADGCGPNENGNMSCSGGGSDNQPSDFTTGESVDIRNWLYDEAGSPQGPTLEGNANVGVWEGKDYFEHTDGCTVGIPTCATEHPLEYFNNCAFASAIWYNYCYDEVYDSLYLTPEAQLGSPWLITTPWIKQTSTGILVCVPNLYPNLPFRGLSPGVPCQ